MGLRGGSVGRSGEPAGSRSEKANPGAGMRFPDQYEEMVVHEIRAAVYTKEMAENMSQAAVKLHKTVYLHIKIDTGMGRIGFPISEESAEIIADIEKLPAVKLEGMFTHFAKADETDKTFSREQHEKFVWMREALDCRNIRIPYLSCDNSAGIIDFPEWKHNLVGRGFPCMVCTRQRKWSRRRCR